MIVWSWLVKRETLRDEGGGEGETDNFVEMQTEGDRMREGPWETERTREKEMKAGREGQW